MAFFAGRRAAELPVLMTVRTVNLRMILVQYLAGDGVIEGLRLPIVVTGIAVTLQTTERDSFVAGTTA